jgi:hypothetical protein
MDYSIDVNAASVLAQVIPALLVILALEDRLSPSKFSKPQWRRRTLSWQSAAVIWNLIALGGCLFTVITKVQIPLWGPLALGATLYALGVLCVLFAGMLGRDEQDDASVESRVEGPVAALHE